VLNRARASRLALQIYQAAENWPFPPAHFQRADRCRLPRPIPDHFR